MLRGWVAVVSLLVAFAPAACQPPPRPGAPTPPPPPTGKLPSSMAALGDSLSAGFGACLFPAPCERNSWSTGDGTQIVSHYERLVDANPKIAGNAHNFAVAKARAVDLTAQARQAVEVKAQYVTVQIGANDACRERSTDMTTPAAFRTDVDRALAVLKKGLPKAKVLVVSIPVAVRAWSRDVCPTLLANPTSLADADADRRRAFRDRITAYDRALEAACAAYGEHCRWDGGAVHKVKFELHSLAPFDFFHPNSAGQQSMADAAFPRDFNW
jgi:lysophospholipase L1-like esterase